MTILSLVATPIFNKLIDKGWDSATAEIHSIRKVGEAIKNLSSVLKKLQQHFKEVEKVESIDGKEDVDSWLEDLKEAAYDAEDILDLFATKTEILKGKKDIQVRNSIFASVADCVGGILSKRETADAINVLLKKLDKIYEERDKFIKLKEPYAESSKNVAKINETGHSVDPSAVVGREVDKNKIIKALTTEFYGKLHVYPILGEGGVGKTTLARLVFNDIEIENHFELRIWVCATDFDLHRILRNIIWSDDKKKNDNLADQSRSQLETLAIGVLSQKRVLLVLDDVWTVAPDHWNSLNGVLQKGADGSRVLVTSREEGNINMMHNVPSIEPLGKLSFKDSSELFWKIASVGDLSDDLRDMGKEIIDKCKGLPLAITAIAGSLRGKGDVKRWMEIAKNDFSKIEKKYLDKRFEILPVLKVSFDHLPSHLKPCFLICSLFPKGHSFDKMDLVKIWMAEGYIPLDEDEKPEDVGDRYFDELRVRFFFLGSYFEEYTIHDLFHQMAIFVSEGNCLQLKDEPLPKVQEKTRHVSLLGESIEPTLELIRKHQKVRTILMRRANLMNCGKILDDLFRTHKYIRVLDLSSSLIDELPDSVKELHLLRYLDLSGTDIKMLPDSICDLWNLQTLRLLYLWLPELPKDLGKLTKLRHIELDNSFWYNLSGLPARVGRMTKLFNQFKFWVGKEKGYRIEELGKLESLTGRLHLLGLENVVNAEGAKLGNKENLNHVVFEWSKKDERRAPFEENNDTNILSGLKPHSNVQRLEIIHFGASDFPEWVRDGSLTKLTTISLKNCNNIKILSLGQLTVLNDLSLRDMPELEMWKTEEGNDWPNLIRLKIVGCPKLRKLPNAFEELRSLVIEECGSLRELPATPHLRFLSLIGNDDLEEWNMIQGPIFVMDLDTLNIERCPKMRRLPEVRNTDLEIINCVGLSCLPPLTHTRNLKHLKLDTSYDGSLLRLIPQNDSLEVLRLSNISKLSSLTELPHLPGLRCLFIEGCEDLQQLWDLSSLTAPNDLEHLEFLSIENCIKLSDLLENKLPAKLQSLSIESCPDLKNLGADDMLKGLESLYRLTIRYCQSLESLPNGGFPDALMFLTIVGCPKIKARYQTETGYNSDWTKIVNKIKYLNIDFDDEANTYEPAVESDDVVSSAGKKSPSIRSLKCWACFRC